MQQVITQSQARAVLNGRAPLIPVEYETACKALATRQAKDVAQELHSKETATARKLAVEIQEWLDEFEQHLPKDAK
jgi:hypothetical protein